MSIKIGRTARKRSLLYALLSTSFVFFLSLLFVPQFLPSSTHAEVGIDPVTTLSISPSSTLSLIAEPGSFVSGTETINVSTNNYTGYTLTMTTNGNSTDLLSSSTDVTIPTITLPEGVDSITSTDFTTAGYGYSLNSTDFMPVPSTDSEGVVIATTTPEDPRTNDHTLTFGAKTDITTPAGTYEKTFTISAIANAAAYHIIYNKNTTDEVTNMPEENDDLLSGVTVILSDNIPERASYTFLGWDEDRDATSPTYTAGGTLDLDPEISNDITLYAVWGRVVGLNFVSNPYSFDDEENTNSVSYQQECEYESGFVPSGTEASISKTPNYADDGTTDTEYEYYNNYVQDDTVSFPGADRLLVAVDYSLYFNYILNFYDGNEEEIESLQGRNTSNSPYRYIVIPGDTVKIELDCDSGSGGSIVESKNTRLSSSGCSGGIAPKSNEKSLNQRAIKALSPDPLMGFYGYYATVLPLYDTEQEDFEYTRIATKCTWCEGTGEYKKPVAPEGKYFIGWSTDPEATSPMVTNESEIEELIRQGYVDAGNHTLYAVYRNPLSVTFNSGDLYFDGDPSFTSYTIDCGMYCETFYVYTDPSAIQTSKTPNLDDSGNMLSPYEEGYTQSHAVTAEGADGLMVEIDKNLYEGSEVLVVNYYNGDVLSPDKTDISGRKETYFVESDIVVICLINNNSQSGGGMATRSVDDASEICAQYSHDGGGGTSLAMTKSASKATSAEDIASGYGYYATITPLYWDEEDGYTAIEINEECFLAILSNDEYIVPDVPAPASFYGWSTDPDSLYWGEYDSYWDLTDIFLSGEESITLYAKYGTNFRLRLSKGANTYYTDYYQAFGPESTQPHDFTIPNTRPNNSGAIFLGWSEDPNATEPSYQPGDTYTATSAVSNLYAVFEQVSYLIGGTTINVRMKNLANNMTHMYTEDSDEKIKAIKRADALPNGFSATSDNTISTNGSVNKTYIFFDSTDGTMYYYAENNATPSLYSDSSRMFTNLTKLEDISGLVGWRTSSTTLMYNMFWNTAITNVDALKAGGPDGNKSGVWDTSKVTSMSMMFGGCTHLANISGLSDWDTSIVANMAFMFSNTAITNVDALKAGGPDGNKSGVWDTSRVTSMGAMFIGISSLTDISGIAGWNTSSVTTMSRMFENDSAITDISYIADWNVDNVTFLPQESTNFFESMFYNIPSTITSGFSFTGRPGSIDANGTYVPSE